MRQTMNSRNKASAKNTKNGKRRSGFAAIFRKELARFFTDRRAVLTTVLLPGLMIYLIYSFIGSGLSNMVAVDESYVPRITIVNAPASVTALADTAGLTLTPIDESAVNAEKEAIAAKEGDLLMVFPTGFDSQLNSLVAGSANQTAPSVELYYNSTRAESSAAYTAYSELLASYRDTRFTLFSINPDTESGATYNLASDQDLSGFLLSSLLPMLITIFLFSGCLAVAPESIAGEKERGTIATLLVTPLKRHELALGKILALSCISLLAAASSFVGIILSIPQLMAGASDMANISLYSINDYLLLLAVIFSSVLLFVGLLSVLSAFAKSIKEASTLAMPLMIIVVIVAVLGSLTMKSANPLFYLIPSLNSAQCMASILSFSADPLLILETVVVNLILAGVCVFALTRMFNSERIVFNR